jgi:hypothetical protein
MAPVFDGASIGLLKEAYHRVYSLPLGLNVFLSSHLAAARMSVQGLATVGLLSTALIANPVAPAFSGARWALQGTLALLKMALRRDSLMKAFLNPVPPSGWLVERVGQKVETFADAFLYHYRTDLDELENHNLDTGAVQKDPPTHPGTLRALKALAQAGGSVASAHGETAVLKDRPPSHRAGARGTYD